MPNAPVTPEYPAFDLLPSATRATLPRLYSQEDVEDPVVHVKVFFPAGRYTAYLTEGQNEGTESEPEWILFGYVINLDAEFGYVSLAEMEELRAFGGLRIVNGRVILPTRGRLKLPTLGHAAR